MQYVRDAGRKFSTRPRGLWCANAGPQTRDRCLARDPAQAAELDYARPSVRPSGGLRVANRISALAPGRQRPRLFFCKFGFGGGFRHPATQDRASPGRRCGGTGRAHRAPDRPETRLSRGRLRRHLGRRISSTTPNVTHTLLSGASTTAGNPTAHLQPPRHPFFFFMSPVPHTPRASPVIGAALSPTIPREPSSSCTNASPTSRPVTDVARADGGVIHGVLRRQRLSPAPAGHDLRRQRQMTDYPLIFARGENGFGRLGFCRSRRPSANGLMNPPPCPGPTIQ